MSKVMPVYVMTCARVEVKLHSFLTLLQTGGDCKLHGPGRYFPLGKPPLPTELKATKVWSKLLWSTWSSLGGKRSASVFWWITGRGGGWEDGSVQGRITLRLILGQTAQERVESIHVARNIGHLQANVNAVDVINVWFATKRGEYFNWARNCETVKEDCVVRRVGQGKG